MAAHDNRIAKPAAGMPAYPAIGESPIPLLWWRTGALAVLIVGWFAANLITNTTRMLDFSPDIYPAVEAGSSFTRLFGALVLFLIADEEEQPRLRWLAASFLLLGLGGLAFGFLPPVLHEGLSTNASMYLSRCVWTAAGVLILIGVLPRNPPPLRSWTLAGVLGATALALAGIAALLNSLPTLVETEDLDLQVAKNGFILSGLTPWHWIISLVPFTLVLIATLTMTRGDHGDVLGGRLLIAMVLFVGAQLHDLLWPSAYGPVLTASDALELIFAAAVAVAGVVELHRIATERAALLAHERAQSQSLRDLAALKSDFTAMIGHELANPLAAIRRQADLIRFGKLEGEPRDAALSAIQTEAKLLTQLVLDVQESARIERSDFDVAPRPYPVEALLTDAAAFARGLPGRHPVDVSGAVGRVRADPERIGQVLRNLVDNAAAYTPAGAPILLRASQGDARIRIAVEDAGPGIAASDLARIFGKFERGQGRRADARRGLGLGLYVARRIIIAHGSDLTVSSTPGSGSVFSFELERAE